MEGVFYKNKIFFKIINNISLSFLWLAAVSVISGELAAATFISHNKFLMNLTKMYKGFMTESKSRGYILILNLISSLLFLL